MRKFGCATAVLLFCASIVVVEAQSFIFQPLQFPDARASATGGIHVALADDITTLVSNPAGFQSVEPQFEVADLTANLTGPVFSLADLVLKVVGGTSPATLLADPGVQSLLNSLYSSAVLNGPLALGYVGNGLGFGFFNSSGVTFTTVGAVPVLSASVHEDLLFVSGYAFRIPLPAEALSTLDIGVSVDAFVRGSVGFSESIITLLSSLNPAVLLSQPFDLDVGFGINTGVLYSWNKTISVGIVGRNLFAPVVRNTYASIAAFGSGGIATQSYGNAPIDLSSGIVYSPDPQAFEGYISSLKVMLDYVDILDFLTHPSTSTNPILHVQAGVEVVMLQILSLRGGFGDGYFTAGLGLDLTAFRFNLSMYGSELSAEPGIRPAYNILVGLEFRYSA